MDRNALDWLFSTAPQALAALVGLIFTGVAFILGAIDKEIARDETREDICDEMKKEIHSNMKYLFILAGVSIGLDLLLVALNPIEEGKYFSLQGTFDPYLLIAGIILLLNLFTLYFSLRFIIRVARPGFFEETVQRLSKDTNRGEIEAKDFIMEYVKLEQALRDLHLEVKQQYLQPPVSEMLRELKYRKLLKHQDINKLYDLTRLRNLIIHGGNIDHVEKEFFDDLKKYTKMIVDLKSQL